MYRRWAGRYTLNDAIANNLSTLQYRAASTHGVGTQVIFLPYDAFAC
jgi:hypothetical protein